MDDHRLDAVVVTIRVNLFQQTDMVADPSRRLGGLIEVVGCLGRLPREIGELVEFRNQPVDFRLPVEAERGATPSESHATPPKPTQPFATGPPVRHPSLRLTRTPALERCA